MKELEKMEDPLLKPLALAAASAKNRDKKEVAPLIKKVSVYFLFFSRARNVIFGSRWTWDFARAKL